MRSRTRTGPVLPGSQRGAIGMLGAIVLFLTLIAVALALDTGRLMLEKRRLQQQADLAALAAAQRFCGGFASTADARDEVMQNLAYNGFVAGSPSDVEVTLGEVETDTRRRTFVEGGSSQAARVRLRRTVPASLVAGGLLGSEATLHAEATAQRDLIAALSVGSRLLSLESEHSQLLKPLLGSLLGTTITLDAASYEGLANAEIPLGLLRDALGEIGVIADVGTLEDLVGAELGLGSFFDVMARALSASGNTASVIVQTLHSQVAAGVKGSTTLRIADILLAETGYPGSEQALNATVNVLDLIMASAMAVNRNSLVTIPNLQISTASSPLLKALVGNLLAVNLQLQVLEPPAIAVGRFGFDENGNPRTRARSAQVELTLALNLNITPANGGLVGGLLSLIANVSGNIAIGLSAAGGSGWLDHIEECPSLMNRDFRFEVGTRTEVASLRIGHPNNTANPARLSVGVALLGLPSIVSVNVDVRTGSQPLLGSSQDLLFDLDLSEPDSLPTPPRNVSTDLSSAISGLGNWNISTGSTQLCVLFICLPLPLGDLVGGLVGVLTPVLSAVAQLVLEPVLQLLGVSVGEVDVRLLDVQQGHGSLLI